MADISKIKTPSGSMYNIKDESARSGLNGKASLDSPAFTGTPTAPTAPEGTNTTQIATTAFVKKAVESGAIVTDAMVFKGTIGSSGADVSVLPSTHVVGWTYKVITDGTYAGKKCEVGDMIICNTAGTSVNDSHWSVVQGNTDGTVVGPNSAADMNVAVFNGSTGKIIKDSGYTIGKSVPSDAKFTDTTYNEATTSAAGLMSAADKTKLNGIATGATANAGTITGIKMNGVSKGTSGVVDLGTVITAHQDISGKKNTQSAVSDPSASGNSLTFIDSISQNAQGVITPTKKTVSEMGAASSSAAGTAGLVPAPAKGDQAKFLRADKTWATPDGTNTHRPINVNGTEVLGNNTTALNLKNGTNVTISASGGDVTINATDTKYNEATTSAAGLMSAADKVKLDTIAAGTITEIKMNGVSKGTSGVVDLGTVITAHQDISGKKNTQSAVSDPSASGNSLTFIDSISQNAQGVITPTKKTVSTMGAASSSAAGTAGLVPAPAAGKQEKFLRGDGTWVGVNFALDGETLVISFS